MYCKYTLPFRDQLLNHNGLTEVPDYRVDPKDGSIISMNPKTMDAPRGIRMRLDRPSTTGSVPLCNIYDAPHIDNYTPYNVNNGQISYYIDNSIKDAYYPPVYNIPFTTGRYLYTDPMTSEKPHYVLIQENRDIDNFCPLSSINDSAFHRENLIAAQQAKFNQTRITPFY
jgi:hypothetical protein